MTAALPRERSGCDFGSDSKLLLSDCFPQDSWVREGSEGGSFTVFWGVKVGVGGGGWGGGVGYFRGRHSTSIPFQKQTNSVVLWSLAALLSWCLRPK